AAHRVQPPHGRQTHLFNEPPLVAPDALDAVLFFFQAEDGIRDFHVTGVQTCALPIFSRTMNWRAGKATTSPSRTRNLPATRCASSARTWPRTRTSRVAEFSVRGLPRACAAPLSGRPATA